MGKCDLKQASLQANFSSSTQFSEAWEKLERLLQRSQFDSLPMAKIINDCPQDLTNLKGVQATQITKIVYDKKEDNLAKLTSVFSTMYASNTPVFIVMNNTAETTEFYIGVNNGADDARAVTDKMKTLEFSLQGNFPGIQYSSGDVPTGNKLAEILNSENNTALACVLGVPSLKAGGDQAFSQGLEKVIEALGKEKYVAILLATPVQRRELTQIESGYQELYSILSMINLSQITLSQQASLAMGKSIANSLATAISTSVAQTKSTSLTKSQTETNGTADTESDFSADTVSVNVEGEAVGGGYAHTEGHSSSHTVSHSIANTLGVTQGLSNTLSQGLTDTATQSLTDSETQSLSEGTTVAYNVQDRHVADSLNLLDEQLGRIRAAKNYGAWNWGVYFLSSESTTAKSCADVFTGVLSGEQTGLERCNSFVIAKNMSHSENNTGFDKAKKALATFNHPTFIFPDGEIATPTTLITTPEVALGMSLPRKSLPSVPVFEVAEFGRSVTSLNMYEKKNKKAFINIGTIYHLGTKTEIPVNLDVDSLCMHTFVTGSTGSGKSNAVYMLLQHLYKNEKNKQKIPFLVVEPAKGEYKDTFGWLEDVVVYGTNPEITNLLRINPFSFPPEIHVMEHIDRLIEILNAAWPMYSAMPAILKDAVELMYERCGWNLLRGENKYKPTVYPDFHDLLTTLPNVIKKSGYSTEVTSNYLGALMTRVKSMTNGYFRTIFQKDELAPEELFDKSCIVDLSRVGSSETKSLLMGIIFMKLQEYRLAHAQKGNQPLRHITVLEEAHNLLRQTSMTQGLESANLMGKSVEMMTNAIAEMRTYGEGFIIADQAPGLLDQAVIRNTNTKIIFRLPDYQDRLLVGTAENLNEQQIDELARLRTGCASVFQNDWQEAVLCQISKFDFHCLTQETNPKFCCDQPDRNKPDSRTLARGMLLEKMLQNYFYGYDKAQLSAEEAKLFCMYYPDLIYGLYAQDGVKKDNFALKKLSEQKILDHLQELIGINEARKNISSQGLSRVAWTREFFLKIYSFPWINPLSEDSQNNLTKAVLKILSIQNISQKQLWEQEAEKPDKWYKSQILSLQFEQKR